MAVKIDEKSEVREFLSPVEMAELLGLGRTTSYKLLREGEIKSFKYGRRRIIARRDIEAWLEQQRVSTTV